MQQWRSQCLLICEARVDLNRRAYTREKSGIQVLHRDVEICKVGKTV